MKSVVILGGGSAGWITALYVRQVFPDISITVIESSDIGILGAGEGTTPKMIRFLDFVGIPVNEIVYNCKATIKNSIRFTGWSYKDKHFYNTFGAYHPYDLGSIDNSSFLHREQTHLSFIQAFKNKDELKDFSFIHKLSDKLLTTFYKNENINHYHNVIEQFNSFAPFAIHFDARLFAQYLKSKGLERNINVIDDIAEDVVFDSKGYVTELKLKNQNIKADFFFDCSGLKRFLVSKFNSQWNSYKKYLPLDRALPFFVQHNNTNIPAFTESIAMDYGWMWRIPVENRFGCGYVFDSSYISEDEAKTEVENKLGFDVEVPKVFKFDAGFYRNVLNKNTLAVGLSAGFIEPLEATSIELTILQLEQFLTDKTFIMQNNSKVEEIYNYKFQKNTAEILDFLALHYKTKRNDTKFWKEFENNNATPDSLKDKLERWNVTMPVPSDFNGNVFFSMHNYMSIIYGLDMHNKDVYKNHLELNNYSFELDDVYQNYKMGQDLSLLMAIKHDEFLNILRKG